MPLLTLGCDVGSRDVGWAVLDDTLVAHGVCDLHEILDGWIPEAWLAEQAHRQIHRSRVTLLALGRPGLTVVGDPAAAWMKGLMGWLSDAPLRGSHAWKSQVRDHVGRMLGYHWPPVKPSDPHFAHDSDAAGLARYARDVALMAARIRARERR